jgi:RING finger and CHY zinc finger domain-containing protein 1
MEENNQDYNAAPDE